MNSSQGILQHQVPHAREYNRQYHDNDVVEAFQHTLQDLLKNNNKELRRPPRVGHKELDLFRLYVAVQSRGGYREITQWKNLAKDLDLPPTVTNSGYTLRTKYESFLLPYEKLLQERFPFLGAEGVREDMHEGMREGGYGYDQSAPETGYSVYDAMDNNLYPGDSDTLRVPGSYNHPQPQRRMEDYGQPGYAPNVLTGDVQPRLPVADASMPKEGTWVALPTQSTCPSVYTLHNVNLAHQPYQPVMPAAEHLMKRLSIKKYGFTDDTLGKILRDMPYLEVLELGSLANLKTIPDMRLLPTTLKILRLYDVPPEFVTSIIEGCSRLQLYDLEILTKNSDADISTEEDTQERSHNIIAARDFNTHMFDNYAGTGLATSNIPAQPAAPERTRTPAPSDRHTPDREPTASPTSVAAGVRETGDPVTVQPSTLHGSSTYAGPMELGAPDYIVNNDYDIDNFLFGDRYSQNL